jgi:GR25 family glycosyltransferase involved in LPS biosynthesis
MRELKRVGWSAEFFPAIRPDGADNFPSVGARGCFLSHLALLKLAISRQLSSITILEDDLNFSGSLQEQWKSALAALDLQDKPKASSPSLRRLRSNVRILCL